MTTIVMEKFPRQRRAATMGLLLVSLFGIVPHSIADSVQHDVIIIAGATYHIGTRVITWMDPGGYDGYEIPSSYRKRIRQNVCDQKDGPQSEILNLGILQRSIDQCVLHCDGHGFSRLCFQALRARGLSVHFMLDVDGIVYQTLDLKERALHATVSNDRSIGIEIANVGAYPPNELEKLDELYRYDKNNRIYIQTPKYADDHFIYTKNFIGRPARDTRVNGVIQGTSVVQYDITEEQYIALIKLTAALCRLFPCIKPDYPRDTQGKLVTSKLSDQDLNKYRGLLGHFHIQSNKTDPGPALQWNKIVHGVRKLLE